MRDHYVTLTGAAIDLSGLGPMDRRFLGQATRAFRDGEAFPNFVNRVNAPGSPALAGGDWVTKQVAASALYRVCQDLADRLGIAQGYLAAGPHSSTENGDGWTPSTAISCSEAARRLGVTPEAVRKAVRQGRLPAHRVGRTYVLDPRAVDAFAVRSGRDVQPAHEAQTGSD